MIHGEGGVASTYIDGLLAGRCGCCLLDGYITCCRTSEPVWDFRGCEHRQPTQSRAAAGILPHARILRAMTCICGRIRNQLTLRGNPQSLSQTRLLRLRTRRCQFRRHATLWSPGTPLKTPLRTLLISIRMVGRSCGQGRPSDQDCHTALHQQISCRNAI